MNSVPWGLFSCPSFQENVEATLFAWQEKSLEGNIKNHDPRHWFVLWVKRLPKFNSLMC